MYEIKNFGLVFCSSLLIKTLAGVLLGWIYFAHYQSGDTISYFEKSVYISGIFWHNPIEYLKVLFLNSYDTEFLMAMKDQAHNIPRTIYFAKILSVLNLFTHNNYWLNSIYLSFFGFAASWKLVHVLATLNPSNTRAIVLSFLFVPSVVFWSSGVLKESLVLGALYFSVAFTIELYQHNVKGISKNSKIILKSPTLARKYFCCTESEGEGTNGTWVFRYELKYKLLKILYLTINLAILYYLKYYLFALVLPLGSSCVLLLRLQKYHVWVRSLSYFLMLGILFWLCSHIYYTLSFEYIVQELVLYHDQMWVYSVNDAQKEYLSLFDSTNLVANIFSIISAIPSAVFYGLFMPLPSQIHYPIQWFAAIENVFLLLLTGWSLSLLILKPSINILKLNLLVYILICAFLFGITTPNWGTLSRYKIVYLPFFVYLITSNLLAKETKKV